MAEETKKTMDSEEVKASEEEKTTREETAEETEKQARTCGGNRDRRGKCFREKRLLWKEKERQKRYSD